MQYLINLYRSAD